MIPQILPDPNEVGIAALLDRRYGDGQVYLQTSADRLLFDEAKKRGLLTEEGLLTSRGRRFWQDHQGHAAY